MPIPYGWDVNLYGAGAGQNQGTSSVPTTPLQGQFFANPQPNQFGVNLNSNVPAPYQTQNTNLFHNQFPVNSNANSSAINKNSVCDTSYFNLVPNLDFTPMSSWDTGTNTDKNSSFDVQQQQNNDLIQIGFEGVLTSDEKEYFSLEYFDPLHRKGRTASVSSPKDLYVNYSFAKPPEDDTDRVNTDRNAWVTFDDDTFYPAESLSEKPVSKDNKPPRPPPPDTFDKVISINSYFAYS